MGRILFCPYVHKVFAYVCFVLHRLKRKRVEQCGCDVCLNMSTKMHLNEVVSSECYIIYSLVGQSRSTSWKVCRWCRKVSAVGIKIIFQCSTLNWLCLEGLVCLLCVDDVGAQNCNRSDVDLHSCWTDVSEITTVSRIHVCDNFWRYRYYPRFFS